MAAEQQILHMTMDADARLAAAAGGVAHFLADEAGLETGAATGLQLAVIEACKEDFKHLSVNHSHLEITFVRFSNRLEISLTHEIEPASVVKPQSKVHPVGQERESRTNSASLAGVDRVQYETHGNEFVTRLTKYLGGDSYPSTT